MLVIVYSADLFFVHPIYNSAGLVPEVPLLQAFENELGREWTLLIITILTITRLYSWLCCDFFSFPFSPTGLVPEVPLLQAFENELGRGWTRLIIAILTIVCLCFSLLELSLPLHRMVSNHFPPSFFSDNFLSQPFLQSLGECFWQL